MHDADSIPTLPIDPASPPPTPRNASPAMSEIVPGLWLGNLECAQHYEWLANEGITHVLSLTSERVTIPVWTGIVHKQFRVRDNRRQNLLAQLIDGMQFLEEAFTGVLPTRARGDKATPDVVPPVQDRPVRVYVHCRMGISRSGSVVVGYLMKYHSRPYKDALAFVRTKRVIVCPNKAFVSQLELLESCAFDVSHLGPELLNPNIDNPYDPYAELDGEGSRSSRQAQRIRNAIPAWERSPVDWCEVGFKSNNDRKLFMECVKAA